MFKKNMYDGVTSDERIPWIKFDGVPVHLAEKKVFNDLAEFYGKVVHASQLSPEVRDLSVNRVGVLVEHGELVTDTAFLSWKGRKYMVWISEEQSDWVPECLVEVIRSESVAGEEEEPQNPVNLFGELKSRELEVEKPCPQKDMEAGINFPIKDLGGTTVNGLSTSQHSNGFTADVGPKKQPNVKKKKPFDLLKNKHKQMPKPSSPNSKNRPKKRTRVDLDRPFEFNIFPAQTHNINISNQEGSPVDRSQEANIGFDLKEKAAPMNVGSKNSSGDTLVDDTQERRYNVEVIPNECEEIIRIRNMFGVDLNVHSKLVKETLVKEGINVVSQ
ncbi:hypothetical protein HanPI659440_Chr04g0156281 [Helianthus annuus]|nr:hypothetical protein HanPI659440_Chr04g0156281 [Helianthus annuus]